MRFFRQLVSLGLIGTSALAYMHMNKGILKGNRVPGEKKIKTEPFTRLDVNGEFEIKIFCDSQEKNTVKICTDENLLETIIVENHDDILKIYLKNRLVRPSEKIIIEIHNPELNSIFQCGLSKIELEGINNEEFTINACVGCRIKLCGKTGVFNVNTKGAVRIDGEDFRCQNLKAHIGGISRLSVQVDKEIEASIVGAGRLDYSGNPELRKTEIIGLGSIKKI
jgi:hypothetical protein